MQLAKVELNDEEVYIKAKTNPLVNHICKLLKIKQLQNINNHLQITDALKIETKDLWGQLSFF